MTHIKITLNGKLSLLSKLKVSFLAYLTSVSTVNLYIFGYAPSPYRNLSSSTPYYFSANISVNTTGSWSVVTFFFWI
ncbi:MAG: hypothetical protein KBC84_07955 [Proteobacteria bacterium]|nr:hypothetical protein [Pseudomonadota bacterium]